LFSLFLSFDANLQRPGRYFEAGYTASLELSAFWTILRDNDLKNAHFDARQHNHIVWKNEYHLAEQLYSFMNTVIGKESAA
jgi:hypothetical protein